MNLYYDDFLGALRSADRVRANRTIGRALDKGYAPEQVLDQVVATALNALGQGWEDGSVSLTQVYMGGRIAEEVINGVLPQFAQPAVPLGKVVIGTLGDHHGLGQRIVAAFLVVAGMQVISLGLGVAPADFVQRAKEEAADLIAISVLMYPSALQVRRVRELLDQERLPIPLLVGGAPFSLDRTLWQRVGASAMGSNPAEGVAVAKRLIGSGR